MNNKTSRVFFHGLRTATIAVITFMAYDYLVKEEEIWNKKNPNLKELNHHKRMFYKFLIVFLADCLIVYFFFKFNVIK